MLNKDITLNQQNKIKDKKKGLERKTKTGNQKKKKIDEQNLQLNILVLFL